MDFKSFSNPPESFRGTDFWMLNDRLCDEELRQQIRDMKKQGIASVIVRTYIGLKSDYPGPDFKSKMRVVVDEAKKVGLKLFMQAGYMPEAVLGIDQKQMLGNLKQVPKGSKEGKLLCSHGEYDYVLVPSERILDMLCEESVDFYIKQSYSDMWNEFRDEFGKTIVSLWVDEPSFRKVEIPWTEKLPETYQKLFGEQLPFSKLYMLFCDDDGAEEIRYRFWRTVLYLLTNSYFKRISDWGKQNKIAFSGHLMDEDTMCNQIRATAFTMPCYKYFDIPGIDNLETALNWQYGRIKPQNEKDFTWRNYGSINTPMQCVSASHQADKSTILCEMYGVSTENLNMRDQKAIFDHFAALGINHRSVHGIFYSLRGRGKRAYPPHVNKYQPYWEEYHNLTDAVARESCFLKQGKPERDIVLLHPIDSAFCMYKGGADQNRELARYDAKFNETLRLMIGMCLNFELGDEDSLEYWGGADENGLKIGSMNYKTVILPYCTNLRSNTLNLLSQHIKNGGKVISLGDAPYMVDGKENRLEIEQKLKGILIAKSHTEFGRLLKDVDLSYKYSPNDSAQSTEIYYSVAEKEKHFFITNVDRSRSHSGTLEVCGEYNAYVLNSLTAEAEKVTACFDGTHTKVLISLCEGEGKMLVLKEEKNDAEAKMPTAQTVICEPKQFSLECHHDNALLLEMFRYALSDGVMSEDTYPIKQLQLMFSELGYKGDITLCCDFECDIDILDACLVLEDPHKQTIFVDGNLISSQTVGCYWDRALQKIKLPALKSGKHTLTVKRYFEPLARPTTSVTSLFETLPGVELEQMLIVGDFSVHSQTEPSEEGIIRKCPHFVLSQSTRECGEEIVSEGYPFYCGSATLSCEFELTREQLNGGLAVCFDGVLAGCGEVYFNGKPQGKLLWPPYKVELKGAVCGKNRLEIKLFGTLKNTVGPWHRPVGEIGAAWGGGYAMPDLPWLGLGEGKVPKDTDWYKDRTPDRSYWTESYLLLPFGVVNTKIILEEKK